MLTTDTFLDLANLCQMNGCLLDCGVTFFTNRQTFGHVEIKSIYKQTRGPRRQLTLYMLSWVSPVLGWALKCLAQGHSHEKPRGSSAAQTQDPWITCHTPYH